ncbi:crossover junction endodeoxyribonuclease RuvC [Chlamydia muridarum str. Nigg]|jgi:crossover junction endodeoxyribonuclease RuvC|uniref:Crossover junction endodeoxyribonuclease RuvC n=2 Tax=Chlamydia muridarum TaxID=83560 RepID=RUVC_CHLMU|nr:crossover junction endodeoxyribonuclease RuvC [Chlamydia muridarum]Q9PJN9.1 RecName: Full=Crossover junction endodeoxyribonuclease RuvC; AltName: Full=Holliday junction nuclease RuvC; AltName: Full=Holliday junction resolvase RuvC [Chlamydia muridarum str. Nigg]UFW21339.1 crossover junction endodeoxyribonuclease RuvC [Chlamydia trachomatis]AAF39592.1 Holliday junction resolvase [Chlamydia muridarum str. Nigg]AHH23175.1 Holliday junction resolvase [Chlamydia muridarum str. Nigg3 CMUT3-5]AHH2
MADLIMGIDPGTLVCGYAFIRVENRYQIQPHSFGKIKLSQKQALSHRYRQLFTEISTILQREAPKAVVLETQYVHKNPQSTIKLGMARGVLLLAASLQDISVFEYAPNTAKKAAVGKGNASKQQVQLMVSKLLNIQDLLADDNEDIADAFALAMCHAHLAPYQDLKKSLL